MTGLRFSLATLFGTIVLVAAGLAVLVNATPLWASAAQTFASVCLLLAVSLAIYRRGAMRSFWIGASLFGWCYLGLAVAPSTQWAGVAAVVDEGGWITNDLLEYLHASVSRLDPPQSADATVVWLQPDSSLWIDGETVAAEKADQALQKHLQNAGAKRVIVYWDMTNDPYSMMSGTFTNVATLAGTNIEYRQTMPTVPPRQEFLQIGHCLFALLFALVGAVVCRVLYQTQERRP